MSKPSQHHQHPIDELRRSRIHPAFIGGAVEIAPDILIDTLTHEVISTPLDDALGRRFTRFGQTARVSHDGLIFHCEDGRVWQVKKLFQSPWWGFDFGELGTWRPHGGGRGDFPVLPSVRTVKKLTPSGGRSGVYLAPIGIGNATYTPPIPPAVLRLICDRHHLNFEETAAAVQDAGGFWTWVLTRPDIPIIVTEGAKKSLAALSQGHVAIALYGCRCGKSPELAPYLVGRRVVVAFDQDTKAKARRAVASGVKMLQAAVQAADGGRLHVAQWKPSHGKGVDDFIATRGAGEFGAAVEGAAPFALYRARRVVRYPLGLHRPAMVVNVPCLGAAIAPHLIPTHGTIFLDSSMGTGKTELIKALLNACLDIGAIAPGNTIGLQRGLGHRLGMAYIDDCDAAAGILLTPPGYPLRRVALCWDSLFKVPLDDFPPGSYDLILDEVDQGLRHLLQGATCGKDGKRPGLMQRAVAIIKGARRVISASATASRFDFELIASLRGEQPWILKNEYQRDRFPVTLYTGGDRADDLGSVLAAVQAALLSGGRVAIATDSRIAAKALELWAKALGIQDTLSFHADNSGDSEQRDFAANPDEYLAARRVQFLVYSPSLTSGVSITGDHFDLIAGAFFGQSITPSTAIQQLGRPRRPVPRVVWCSQRGRGGGERWAEAHRKTEARRAGMVQTLAGQSLPILDPSDPISTYLAETGAGDNLETGDFGAFFQARLEAAGHIVCQGAAAAAAAAVYEMFKAARKAVKSQEYRDRFDAPQCDATEGKRLKDTPVLSYRERCKLERWQMQQFYVMDYDGLTFDDIERDRGGKYQREITRLECLLYQDLARVKDEAALKELTRWNAPILSHDLPMHRLHSEGAIALGLPDLVQQCMGEGWHNTTGWAVEFCNFAKVTSNDVRTFLGFSIHPSATPCQVIGMVLRSLGIKTTSTRLTNENGDRYRLYTLESESLEILKGILQRRAQRHAANGIHLRPHPLNSLLLEGMDAEKSPPEPPPIWRAAAAATPPATPFPSRAIA